MIGDRLIPLQRHKNNADLISNQINFNKGIILIYGSSGTGKSETADFLQEKLFKKHTSLVLSMDDFYLVHPTVRNINRKKQGVQSVGLSEINWIDLVRICEDFQNKRILKFQRVHKYCDVVEHNQVESESIDYLIIEGLYAGYLKKYNFGNLITFLEGTGAQTLEFRQNRGKENPEDPFRQQVVQKENKVIGQLKKYANLIIPFYETNN